MNNIYKLVSGILLTLLLFVSCHGALKPASAAVGDTWFVSKNGTGTECSRTNPGPLQYCVEQKAQSGDTVYVGEGFYVADDPTDDNLLLIEKSIHLIGSCTWDATGPITCEPQNVIPAITPSRLNGENERRVIAIEGPGISVTIEGFIIYQGNADGKEPKPTGPIGAGGGIYANDIESLVVKNNYIWANSASKTGGSLDFGRGGGIYASFITNLTIEHNTIIFNSSSSLDVTGYGGGLYIMSCGDGGEVKINFNHINGNRGGKTNTSSRGAGANLYKIDNLQLDHNIFEYQNTIPPGECWNHASALSLNVVLADSIDQNIFRNNYGETIVYLDQLDGNITRNKFWDNEALYDLYIKHENEIQMSNNFFGKLFGTTMASTTGTNEDRGGVSTLIYIGSGCGGDPKVSILHNTFAFAKYGVQIDGLPDVEVYRNIFTSHEYTAIDVLNPSNTNIDVDENLFWKNHENGETGTTAWIGDPLLVDKWNGDFHLQPGSAAIDKVSGGTITTDIDGDPRPIGSGIDLGADEFGFFILLPLIVK